MDAVSNAQNVDKHEPGAMKPYDLKRIETELRDLWKPKGQEESKKQTTTRTCVLNFLIYEESVDEAENLGETIIEITKHHPSRVILMSTQPNSLTASVRASVSEICHFAPGSGKQVCAEMVHVSAEGDAVKRLAPAVIALFVPDLPETLWWRGMPMEGQPFKGLLATVDRIVLDSSNMQRPTAFISVLANLAREHDEVAFSDLNWSRLTQLRSHIAGIFDVPDLRAHLWDLSKVSLEYPSSEADRDLPSPQALLLLSWFASRLHWNSEPEIFQSKGGAHMLKFKSGEREIACDLVPSDSLNGQDLKLTMTMADASGWQTARIRINRAYGRNAIETKLETPTICWLKDVAKYEMPSEAQLLSNELDILGHDMIYESVLDYAGRILERM